MEDTEDGITLGITTNGLVCALSKYLPQYISKHIGPFTDRLLSRNGATREDGKKSSSRETILLSVVQVLNSV